MSSDWSSSNSTKVGLYGNVYDFAVDYEPLNGVGTIYDIHRYLMEKMALYKMFSFMKKVKILVSSTVSENFIQNSPNCLLFKNQECKVKKVIIDNDYITFPYKIKVDKCVESCNDVENPYFKVCLPGIVKNISVTSFDLISRKNVLRNVSFHKSCKCDCLLDEKVCDNKQKWNKEKCRCECLEI